MSAREAKRAKKDTLVWTSSQLCQALGISSAELSRRTLSGSISGRVGFGKYDPILAVRSQIEALSADLARVSHDDDSAIRAARLRWFESRASTAELELAQRRGEVRMPLKSPRDCAARWRRCAIDYFPFHPNWDRVLPP